MTKHSYAASLRHAGHTRWPPTNRWIEGIFKEREQLEKIKTMADKVFDTSDLTVHELRRAFMDLSRGDDKQLMVTLVSFGYKHGVPLESDLLLDVRFLPNPHFVRELRPLTGRDRGVQEYLDKSEATRTFLDKTTDLLRFPNSGVLTRGEKLLDSRDWVHRGPAPVRGCCRTSTAASGTPRRRPAPTQTSRYPC